MLGKMGNNTSVKEIEDIPEDNGIRFRGKLVPEEILCIIFSFVPGRDLLRSVTCVCKYWHDLLTHYHFWFRKLEVERITLSDKTKEKLLSLDDERSVLYILQGLAIHYLPLNRNLIKNPCGANGMKYWQCQHNKNMITVESTPIGSDPIPEEAGLPTQHCFVTSYMMSCRTQTFTLNKLGISPKLMDLVKPDIYVCQWVSGRWDCRSQSEVVIELCGTHETRRVKLTWSSDDDDVVARKWYKMETTITDYPEGLSRISYSSFGKDLQFWAGFYGSKTTGSTLKLVFN
ncbi:F-box only protein 6-like isoform X2 [Penaeus chinensis]|uniref:F-box only protein 6-like isoform X2 n=1 Tax=Penaeus chinensis TaxID=139456 RepID=UPI001FB62821|nr:F-box only protein 6-like isoform X2 [Penaeus chinensis]